MSTHPTERLSELLDATLSGAERVALESHVAGCATCRELLAQLTEVRERARRLPALPPVQDLWPAIEARLDAPDARPDVVPIERARAAVARTRREPRWSFSFPQLAAAVLAATLVSAGAMWLVLNRGPRPGTTPAMTAPGELAANPPATGTAQPPTPAARLAPGAEVLPAGFDAARYDAAIAELELTLSQHKQQLDPRTVVVVERNLALIDQAIEQARRALAADPASAYLNTHLASTMRRKVDLLRRVTSAVRS